VLHGFAVVWHRSAMTTTEDRPVSVGETPVYDYTRKLAIGKGFDPEGPPSRTRTTPTSRQLAAGRKLSNTVWADIVARASTVDWTREDATLGEGDAGNDSDNAPESGAA